MKRILWGKTISALAAALLAAGSLNAQVAGRLSGSVIDPSGAAITGAAVNVYVPGGKAPVLSGVTNEAGLFTFMAVRPASYDVFIEASGFAKLGIRDVRIDPLQERSLGIVGSAQEFDGRPILGHFPKNDEFGLEGGHPLRLQEQVSQVFVSSATAHEGLDVPVDGFYYTEGDLRSAVVQNAFQMIQ